MGGTFDPIHHGHLVAASEVAHFFSLDEVVFVPTGLSSHKGERKVAAAEDRYLMAVIATASNPGSRSAGSTSTGPARPTPSTPCATSATCTAPTPTTSSSLAPTP